MVYLRRPGWIALYGIYLALVPDAQPVTDGPRPSAVHLRDGRARVGFRLSYHVRPALL